MSTSLATAATWSSEDSEILRGSLGGSHVGTIRFFMVYLKTRARFCSIEFCRRMFCYILLVLEAYLGMIRLIAGES